MKETWEEGIETSLARNLGQREGVGEMKIKTFFQKSTESTDWEMGGDGIDLSSLSFLYAVWQLLGINFCFRSQIYDFLQR